jgi:maltose O-acetyltransferase
MCESRGIIRESQPPHRHDVPHDGTVAPSTAARTDAPSTVDLHPGRPGSRSFTPRAIVAAGRRQLRSVSVRWILAQVVLRLLPPLRALRLRREVLRAAGWRIGDSVTILGIVRVFGSGRHHPDVTIGEWSFINVGCTLELSDRIVIGRDVALGPDVMILTGTHQVGSSVARAGPFQTAPVTVGDGAWIGARCVLLPGVNVGAGAVVAAGAIVRTDVAPNTLVAGVPAVVVKTLTN